MRRTDTNRNLVAAISYIPLISIFIAVAIYWVEKDDKFIRFHALQAILVSIVYLGASFIVGKIPFGPSLNGPFFILFLMIWLVSMYRAFRGQVFKWPIIGDFAEGRLKG